jgi:hypothetical protein
MMQALLWAHMKTKMERQGGVDKSVIDAQRKGKDGWRMAQLSLAAKEAQRQRRSAKVARKMNAKGSVDESSLAFECS